MTQPDDKNESRVEELVERFDRLIDRPECKIDSGELSRLSDEEIFELNRRLQCLDLLEAARPANTSPDPDQTTIAKAVGPNDVTPGGNQDRFRQRGTSHGTRNTGMPQVNGLEVLKRIGSGGYGDVFLALDPKLDRYVALKVPRLDRTPDTKQQERFEREARAAGMLSHPAIIPLYQSIIDETELLLVYAYAKGPSLTDWLQANPPPLASQDAARLVARLSEAIQHAHARGVVHRDLKPGNLLFWQDITPNPSADELVEKICIADFGLARVENGAASLTVDGDILGTPSYMSPEQASAAETDHRSDIFSLGAILYELLIGQPPFARESTLQTIRSVVSEPTRWPNKSSRETRDIRAICEKCLEKQPRHRYQTAQELADDLDRFVNGHPISARRPTALERCSKWYARNRTLGSLAAALILSLLIGTCVSSMLGLKAASNADTASQNEMKWRQAAGQAMENEQIAIQEREQATALLHRVRLRNYGYELSEAFRLADNYLEQDALDIIASSPLGYRDVEHDLAYSLTQSSSNQLSFDETMERCFVAPDRKTLVTLHESGFSFFDLTQQSLTTQLKTDLRPTSFVYSPELGYLATILIDGEIVLLDRQGVKLAQLKPIGTQRFDCMSFSRNGDSLLIGISGERGNPRIAKWRYTESDELQTLKETEAPVRSILVDAASDHLIAATTHSVRVLTLPNLDEQYRFSFLVPNRPCLDLANNRLLVAHADRQVTSIDLESGQATLSFRPHASTCRVTRIPGSDRVATWDENGRLILSDAKFGEPVLAAEASDSVLHECLFLESEGTLIVVSADGIRFFDCNAHYPHAKIDLQGNVRSIQTTTQGDVISTVGSDNRLHRSIQITKMNWRFADPLATYQIHDLPWRTPAIHEQTSSAFLIDGEKVKTYKLSGARDSARQELESEITAANENFWLAKLDTNERFLYVTGKSGVHRFDLNASERDKIDRSFLFDDPQGNSIQCCVLDVDAQSDKLACGFAGGQVVVFDSNTGEQIHDSSCFPGAPKSVVSSLSFSSNGRLLVVSYSGLGTVILDTDDDFSVLKRFENGGSVSTFSNDGKWLALESQSGATTQIEIYDSQTYSQVAFFPLDHFGIDALRFTNDDRWLISGSPSFVDSLRIWDLEATLLNAGQIPPATKTE